MSNDKVIELYPSDEPLCNQDVIKTLEDALEEAKEGKAMNCAIAMVNIDNSLSYSYSNHYMRFTLVGIIRYLESLIMSNEN